MRLGWKRRSRAIADALRGAVLRDADHHSVRASRAAMRHKDSTMDGSPNDDRFIDAVEEFLARTGPSEPEQGIEAWRDRRMAFKDLDIAIEQRFSSCAEGRGAEGTNVQPG
jgi:hypothetical protein